MADNAAAAIGLYRDLPMSKSRSRLQPLCAGSSNGSVRVRRSSRSSSSLGCSLASVEECIVIGWADNGGMFLWPPKIPDPEVQEEEKTEKMRTTTTAGHFKSMLL